MTKWRTWWLNRVTGQYYERNELPNSTIKVIEIGAVRELEALWSSEITDHTVTTQERDHLRAENERLKANSEYESDRAKAMDELIAENERLKDDRTEAQGHAMRWVKEAEKLRAALAKIAEVREPSVRLLQEFATASLEGFDGKILASTKESK